MMLLEHDAKQLLQRLQLPVPPGRLATNAAAAGAFVKPVVLKAQVPVGGRGLAGGIKLVRSADEYARELERILAMSIKGHAVRACRIEDTVEFVGEAYLSFTIDARHANVRILMSAQGGVDIESAEGRKHLQSAACALDAQAMRECVATLAEKLPDAACRPIADAAQALIPAFFEYEAMLLEINPLFIRADGSWVIGDTKLVVDDNAFERQPIVQEIVENQPTLYPEAALKLNQGFDFVILDKDGDIGLVTTGAGLSMQLVDELVARGHSPYNFCDIRTGMFRGDPGRLIQVLQWIAAGPSIRTVLINFFAGLTDLGELAHLLLQALKAVPELKVPVTARLIGNNLEEARRIIAEAGNPIAVETDLERAIDLATANVPVREARHG